MRISGKKLNGKLGTAIVLCLAIAACSSPEEVEDAVGGSDAIADKTGEPEADPSNFEELAAIVAPEADAVEFSDTAEQGEAVREFTYSWPRQVSAIPGLVAVLEQERTSEFEKHKAMWQESLEEFAGEDCFSCTRLAYGREWKVVANLDRFLSLSADHYEYTGGAHGNYWFDSKVWDRTADVALAPGDMFTSQGALWTAIEAPYCAGLGDERVKKFGADDANVGTGWGCPGLDELTLLVGSSNGKTFDRLGLLAAPYVAGSYAEGSYEVTVPVTDAVLNAVKPDYKSAFSVQ